MTSQMNMTNRLIYLLDRHISHVLAVNKAENILKPHETDEKTSIPKVRQLKHVFYKGIFFIVCTLKT